MEYPKIKTEKDVAVTCVTTAIRIAVAMLCISVSLAAQGDALFDKDIEKQKQSIESDFGKCTEFLSKNQIGQTRDILELIVHRLDGLKKDLAREERDSFKQRTDKVNIAISAKEDSLVKRNLEILDKQGMDAAIAFLREVLEPLRVGRDKVKQVDEAIVMAASNQKTPEEKALEEAKILVAKGMLPEQIKDDLVKAAARRVIQQQADSLRAVQDSVRAAREEQARLQKLENERLEAERRKKEEAEQKRKEEELARIEKTRLDSIDRVRKESEREHLRVEKDRVRKEKLELDSLAAAQKLQQKQSKQDRKRTDDLEREREQAIRDSIIHSAEANQRKLDELDRKQQQRTMDEEQKRRELATIEQSQSQRKAAEAAERERQIRTSEQKRIENERVIARQREQEEREKLALIEKQRLEKATQAEQEKRRIEQIEQQKRLEEQNRRQQFEAEEKERQRIEAENRRIQEASRKTAKIIAPPSAPKTLSKTKTAAVATAPAPVVRAPSPASSLPTIKKTAPDPLEAKAQKSIEEIYSLLEKDDAEQAYSTFQRSRSEIARHASPEIYTTLEMTVLESYMEAQKKKKADLAVFTGSPTYETYEPEPDQSNQNARFQAAKIEGLLRQNKIRPAYEMFQRVKKDLKKNLERDIYKKLEEKIENAYKAIR
jgi:trichohyalin